MQAYLNGSFVDEADARVSVKDRGFVLGDAVFEVWRTYGGHACADMVDRHLIRLTQSLNYMELEPAPIVNEVKAAADALVQRNRDEIASGGDVLVFTIVTRGLKPGPDEAEPTISVVCNTMPAAPYADDLYANGARLLTSLMYRDPWGAVDPRIKTTSRFGYVRAERKMRRTGPGTWTVFYDNLGNLTEAAGANLLLVKNNVIVRPPRERVLGGINMATFIDLAAKLGVPAEERSMTLYDYVNADEVILTTTSIGAVRVTDIDGITLRPSSDVYDKVLDKWFEYVDCDFVSSAGRPLTNVGAEATGVLSGGR